MSGDYERVLLVKPDVFIYRIPPRSSNRGFRASDWKLDEPDWTARMRVVSKGKECFIKLEDKTTGNLFAQCPVDKYPGISVETVVDSSRYFVFRIVSDDGKAAFIGVGFADRGDSFDLNVALSEHFKGLEKELENNKAVDESVPKLDLKFKEGQTIKVNLNILKKSSSSRPKGKGPSLGVGGGILLPPPPAGIKLPSQFTSSSSTSSPSPSSIPFSSNFPSTNTAVLPSSPSTSDFLVVLSSDPPLPPALLLPPASSSPDDPASASTDLFAEFDSLSLKPKDGTSTSPNPSHSAASWAQF